jgi:Zn-dependent M28 family amino/carboxypeptidase
MLKPSLTASRAVVALLASLALIACGRGPAPAAVPAAALPGTEDAIRAHVAFLADDLLEGRLAGSRGHDIAARYVASQLAQIGVKPGGVDGSWYQDVPLVEALAVIPAARMMLLPTGGGKPMELQPAEDFLPGSSTTEAEVRASAPVVFVGFGVVAPDQGHDDLAGIDLKGKVALMLGGAPAKFPPEVRAHHSSGLTKFPALIERGAVGVIQFPTPEDAKRDPWARAVQQSWRPRMSWVQPDGQPSRAYPQLRIRAALNPASAPKFFAGAPRTIEQVYAAAEAGTPQAFDLPVSVELLRRSVIGRKSSPNVIGLLEGSDPALKGEYIAISAHLDHVGKGAPVNGDSIYNGALDNAVGIAIMLETARLLATSPQRPRRSILFLAVTAEETGLVGSDYFVQNPTVQRGSIVANVNMDMPVALAPLASVLVYGAEHSSLGAAAERAAQAEGVTLAKDEQPEETFFVRSDQYSFVRAGIPALYVDQGFSSKDPALDQKALVAGFLKDRYHQPSDDLSVPIHWPSLAMLARLNTRIIGDVATADARPAWNPGNFFGETFAKPSAP